MKLLTVVAFCFYVLGNGNLWAKSYEKIRESVFAHIDFELERVPTLDLLSIERDPVGELFEKMLSPAKGVRFLVIATLKMGQKLTLRLNNGFVIFIAAINGRKNALKQERLFSNVSSHLI
jgi:hypothetical protein